MNEALLAEAACDYEDGMDLITADLTTWAVEQGAITETDRATFQKVSELCRQTIESPERAEMQIRHAKEAFAAGRVAPGAVRFAVERIVTAAECLAYVNDLKSCLRLAIAMMRAATTGSHAIGEEADDGNEESRRPHPLRQQLEYELRTHGLGLAIIGNVAVDALDLAMGGGGPKCRLFLDSLAGQLLRSYLEGKTAPMEGIRGFPSSSRTRHACRPDEELETIAAGETDYGRNRRERSRTAMETLLHDVEATASAMDRWVESGGEENERPRELDFHTMVRALTVPHPLVGPSGVIQAVLVHMVAEQMERREYQQVTREARALLDTSAVLVRAILRNARVCAATNRAPGIAR